MVVWVKILGCAFLPGFEETETNSEKVEGFMSQLFPTISFTSHLNLSNSYAHMLLEIPMNRSTLRIF